MEELNQFVIENKVMKSNHLINEEMLIEAEKTLGVKFGKELTEYLRKYGYLICKGVELYGMNPNQFLDSDIITQTIYLHKYFPDTIHYVALENQGEGDYFLVDSEDDVYEFVSEQGKIITTGLKMFAYIIKRFRTAINK